MKTAPSPLRAWAALASLVALPAFALPAPDAAGSRPACPIEPVRFSFPTILPELSPFPKAPFAQFKAEGELRPLGGSLREAQFELAGGFTLGMASSGIDPLHEIVMLNLSSGAGSIAVAIPRGSFTKQEGKPYEFDGTVQGIALRAQILPLHAPGRDYFVFQVEGKGALSMSGPLTSVTLSIGDNSGTTRVER